MGISVPSVCMYDVSICISTTCREGGGEARRGKGGRGEERRVAEREGVLLSFTFICSLALDT